MCDRRAYDVVARCRIVDGTGMPIVDDADVLQGDVEAGERPTGVALQEFEGTQTNRAPFMFVQRE
jgi:hypothetical protein